MKKILHKWDWFWFSYFLKRLKKDWEQEVYESIYETLSKSLEEIRSICYVSPTTEEIINDIIARASGLKQ